MKVTSSLSHAERAPIHPAFVFQRRSLAVCILLAPLSITLYLLSWEGNQRAPLTPRITSAMAGPTGNLLHFIGAIAAFFFLPLGYLGMSLLGIRRAPWLATISAALSLVGWIPWAALMGLDSLAYDIGRGQHPTAYRTLDHLQWRCRDDNLSAHLRYWPSLSALLIGFMLGRLRLIPTWAAWAFALTSPLTIPIILVHTVIVQDVLKYLVCALWIIGAIPATLTMLTNKDLAQPAPGHPSAEQIQ